MPTDPPSDNDHAMDSEESAWLAQYYTHSKTHDTVEADENTEGDPARVSTQLFPSPTQKYQVGDEIGAGGMKSVQRAYDLNANRDVAMAKLREASAPPRRMRRFVREARITAALEHPNIVPVHEIGLDEAGKPYFTMKLLGGETLHGILKKLSADDAGVRKKYPLARLLSIFQSVCNAVAFAHSRGIIHLDLKPSNIQVGDFGEVLVLDWGLSKMMEQSDALPDWLREIPQEGVVRGTPGFMAPEQARGDFASLNERADIYALGAVLSAILARQPAPNFKGKNRTGRNIPPALAAVVSKATSDDPQKRYPSVKELAAEVQAFIGGFATAAQQAGALTHLRLLIKRHSVVVSLITISLILIISILSISLVRIQRSERVAVDALARIKAEQESKMKIGLIAAPRVVQQAEDLTHKLDYDQAIQSLDYAVVLDGNLESAWWWKASLHLGRMEFKQASDAFDQALRCKYGDAKRDKKTPEKPASLEQVARKYAELVRQTGGVLPHEKMAQFVSDINGATQTGWWFRNAALGTFFQHQNRTAPDLNLIDYSLHVLNPDAKDLQFTHQDYPEGYIISVKGGKVDTFFPLIGLKITRLDLSKTGITDLFWMRDMPLTSLDLSDTGGCELYPLNNVPTLVELRLVRWQHRDFNQVRQLSQLERLVVARNDASQAQKDLTGHGRKPPVIIGE